MPWKVQSSSQEVPFSGFVMDFAWSKIHQNLKNMPVILTTTMKFMLFQPLQVQELHTGTKNARGSVFGLTRGTTKEDFIKATLQSIAYQVRDIIDTMQVDAQTAIQVLKVDGGAAMNNFLMQFQADILGIDIARAKKLGNNSSRCSLLSRFVSRLLEGLG